MEKKAKPYSIGQLFMLFAVPLFILGILREEFIAFRDIGIIVGIIGYFLFVSIESKENNKTKAGV